MVNFRLSLSKPLLGSIFIISVLAAGCGGTKQQAAGPQALPVQLQTLQTTTIIDGSEFVGNLIANQFVQLAPQIQGRIKIIYVNYGAQVKKGDPIALLEPFKQVENVNAQLGNLNQQKANFDVKIANLRTSEAERDSVASAVATNKANLANAQEVLKTKEADLRKSQSDLKLAQIDFDRAKFLVATGAQPQQDLDNKTTALTNNKETVQAASKTVAAAQASVQAAEGALSQSLQNVKAAEQRVVAARGDVNAQKAAIKQAQGQLGSSTQELIYNTVSAPINGVVGNIPFKVGDMVNISQSFTTITNNSVMAMDINIPIERAHLLRKGLPVEIINTDGSKGVTGSIGFISPTVNQEAQAVLVKVFFNNDGSLRNRQYVRVRVIWNQKPGVLIPTTAITNSGSQKFVFVAEPGEKKDQKESLVAKQKPIQVGNIQGQSYQILSGVEAGERVAVTRILDLRDGLPIVNQEAKTKK